MAENHEKLDLLLKNLEVLLEKQEAFSKEVNQLQSEIQQLKRTSTSAGKEEKTLPEIPKKEPTPSLRPFRKQEKSKAALAWDFPPKSKKPKIDFEKVIGENLANKIGIIIVIIGVAIGAKYTIENQLIGPLTRIIIGYGLGIGLMGFAIKLKEKYGNFSAVLLSGAMAIMYFITFAAFSFYGLIGLPLTFALMVIFTAFTVLAALHYDKQVIAHIGLVGAYAVPFLLSDGSGNVGFLFSYIAIINAGILVIAIKKYWKALYYSAFGLTWIIYLVWFVFDYRRAEHFGLAMTFLVIFFVIFYLAFLAYKFLQKEKFNSADIIMLMTNAFIFYGIGYALLSDQPDKAPFLGLFTLANAIIHFLVSLPIYRRKLADRNLFYLVIGLVLIFVTLTFPVQLDGNWVTLLWTGEAALLFWIGRTKQVAFYEKMAYPLMLIAFFSLIQDWSIIYATYYPEIKEAHFTPLINIHFLSSLLFLAGFGWIYWLQSTTDFSPSWKPTKETATVISFGIPAILLFSAFYTLLAEINTYWQQLYVISEVAIDNIGYVRNEDLLHFKSIWAICYSLAFLAILAILNFKKLRSQPLGWVNLVLLAFALLIFLTDGLYALSELRVTYLDPPHPEYFAYGFGNIIIRYISFVFVGLALIAAYFYRKQAFMKRSFVMAFDFGLHLTLVWTLSSELIHWMDMAGWSRQYKLGLSIFWGVYALTVIGIGIWKNKKYLRIAAIALFGLTLLKLFFYDISHLDTIAKTVVFISLGILLLIISFLYNKFKHIITDETDH
ncbi:DUF2339 domain-containing protein [Echinicola strongylocentroti]|uniref:DUF2339 domain-containing protein n=1 Tax=Echinicola strongylocentroti TaxID=1795355 RepID=A0A2Z4IQJ2_9BACT|nr:DUF2339 domain-containing protein [Echinicola strongylocentroti]AWW32826.1 DUF2339 domain-containing protein [Echinicola strongylocentroti]